MIHISMMPLNNESVFITRSVCTIMMARMSKGRLLKVKIPRAALAAPTFRKLCTRHCCCLRMSSSCSVTRLCCCTARMIVSVETLSGCEGVDTLSSPSICRCCRSKVRHSLHCVRCSCNAEAIDGFRLPSRRALSQSLASWQRIDLFLLVRGLLLNIAGQQLARSVEACFYQCRCKVEHAGNLFVGEVVPVSQNNDGAILARQPLQVALDFVLLLTLQGRLFGTDAAVDDPL